MTTTTNVIVSSASDLVFKTIMLGKNGKVILEKILSNIFKENVLIKRYLNVELPKFALNERSKRLDLLVDTNIGYINIEVNNNDYFKEKIARKFMYLCEFLVQNVKKGQSYKLDKAYIQLNLNFGTRCKSNYLLINGKLINEEKVLVDNFKILGYFMEKLVMLCYNDDVNTNYYKYILMLGMNVRELKYFYPNDEIIKLYKEELMKLESNADFVRMLSNDQEQELYENTIREESFKNGRADGELKTNKRIVENMKKSGMDIKKISKYTGLSKKQIMML